MSVPESLEGVLRLYPFRVRSVAVENSKERKSVWWLNTDRGRLVLKKSPNPPRRMRFVAAVASHLRERGVAIPETVPSLSGEPWVEWDGSCYVVSIAAPGRAPSYFVKRERDAIMRALAGFHLATRGFVAPDGSDVRSHLGGWDDEYEKRIADLERFAQIASADDSEFSRVVRREAPALIARARSARERLDGPAYARATARVASSRNICHQDFAAGNLSLDGDTVYVFDLDSVTVDHEARDLRKVVNKVMKKAAGWSAALLADMLASYQEVNPLRRDDRELLAIDLAFPHLFHGVLSKFYDRREPEWSPDKFLRRLNEIVALERSAVAVLSAFDRVVGPPSAGTGGGCAP